MARMLGMLLLTASVLGCAAGQPTYPTARLEGKITVDDQPIPEGNLQFVPQDGGQAPITSAPIVDGRYVAEAVPRGRLRVLLSATKAGKMIKEYSTPRPEVINLIPAKYRNSGIPIEVTGDNGNLNFSLRSR